MGHLDRNPGLATRMTTIPIMAIRLVLFTSLQRTIIPHLDICQTRTQLSQSSNMPPRDIPRQFNRCLPDLLR